MHMSYIQVCRYFFFFFRYNNSKIHHKFPELKLSLDFYRQQSETSRWLVFSHITEKNNSYIWTPGQPTFLLVKWLISNQTISQVTFCQSTNWLIVWLFQSYNLKNLWFVAAAQVSVWRMVMWPIGSQRHPLLAEFKALIITEWRVGRTCWMGL